MRSIPQWCGKWTGGGRSQGTKSAIIFDDFTCKHLERFCVKFSIDMEAYFVEPPKRPVSQVHVTFVVPSERFHINYNRLGLSLIAQVFAAYIKQFQESFFYE